MPLACDAARRRGRRVGQNVGVALRRALRLGRSDLSARGRARVRRVGARHRAARPVGWNAPFPERLDERQRAQHRRPSRQRSPRGSRIRRRARRSARPAARSASATISSGKRSSCAPGITTRQVFGKRGPWHERRRTKSVTSRTLPSCAYVAPQLLVELGVDDRPRRSASRRRPRAPDRQCTDRRRIPPAPHMAVKTEAGYDGPARSMTNRAIRGLATFFVAALHRARRTPDLRSDRRRAHDRGAARQPAPRAARRGPRAHPRKRRDRSRRRRVDGQARLSASGRSSPHWSGYVSPRYGTSGIEAAFDRALSPPDSAAIRSAQLRGARVRRCEGSRTQPRGADVVTTIVPPSKRSSSARCRSYPRAAGVVLDPRSGAVLALASVPSFDPNDFDAEFPHRCATTPARRCSIARSTASIRRDRRSKSSPPPRRSIAAALTMDSHFEDPGYLHDRRLHAARQRERSDRLRRPDHRLRALEQRRLRADRAEDGQSTRSTTTSQRWGIGASLDFQLPAQRDRTSRHRRRSSPASSRRWASGRVRCS